MFEFIESLMINKYICSSPVVQSIALDILIWVASIRLTRLRSIQNSSEIKALQLETIRSVQGRLSSLLRTCLLHAGRSIAHKCVKLIVLCSGWAIIQNNSCIIMKIL